MDCSVMVEKQTAGRWNFNVMIAWRCTTILLLCVGVRSLATITLTIAFLFIGSAHENKGPRRVAARQSAH